MAQTLDWPSKNEYLGRLFGSHDFAVEVDILNFNEEIIGSARFLDGQVNLQDSSSLIRRTCDLTLSDPDGALDFSTSSAWSGTSVYIDRMVRVRHVLAVGNEDVTAIPFIGPPATVSRSGAEVSITCEDKAALAMSGSLPYTVKEGALAVASIRAILADCVGEFRFRLPSSTKRLSKDYSVGLDDSASPMVVAAKIARAELGMQLLYSCDGYAMLRALPATSSLTVPGVTEPATSDVDYKATKNYVKVLGKATTKTSGKTTIKTQPVAIARIKASSNLSPEGLSRKGVPIYRPLVITEDAYTKQAQVEDRANAELNKVDQLASNTTFSCVPFFHADSDDLITVQVAGANQRVRLVTGTIPLGVGGDMTIGTHRWASKQPAHKSRVTTLRWKKFLTGTKKHRKTHWRPI